MPELKVRPAQPADRQRILEFHRALYVDYRDMIVPRAVIPLIAYRSFEEVLRDDVDALLKNPSAVVLLAERDGEPLGYITGHIEADPRRLLPRRGVVEDWYVTDEGRGEGVGRTLMDALEAIFTEAGCDLVESATWSANHKARAVHEAMGFLEVQVTYRKPLGT